MKKSLINAVVLVIWALPIIYLCVVYSSLPAVVPLHFGINGRPDGFGAKSKFLAVQIVLSFTSGGVYLLMKYVVPNNEDQMKKYSPATLEKVAIGTLMFMSFLGIGITLSTIDKNFKGDKIIFPAMGLLFAFLGNMMYSVKRNRFFGVRVSWTLNNEDNWRATHQFAGKLWFVGGIILAVLTLFLPTLAANIAFGGIMILLCTVPLIYSYRYHKQHPANKGEVV